MTGRAVVAAVLIALVCPGVARAQTIEEQQWHLAALNVPAAHATTRGDGVVVAVVDSGVDDTRPDLAGALLPGTGFGSASGTDGTEDNDGHGTAMATLIAGRAVDGGALGVAPGAMILPVSVGADGDKFTTASVAEGVTWAVDHGAHVINLSLGGNEDSRLLRDAMAYATDQPTGEGALERGVFHRENGGVVGNTGVDTKHACCSRPALVGDRARGDARRRGPGRHGDLPTPAGRGAGARRGRLRARAALPSGSSMCRGRGRTCETRRP